MAGALLQLSRCCTTTRRLEATGCSQPCQSEHQAFSSFAAVVFVKQQQLDSSMGLERRPAGEELWCCSRLAWQVGSSSGSSDSVVTSHFWLVVCVCCTCRQLMANIAAAQSLDQLQLLINRHAHQMNVNHLARAISKTPQVRWHSNCLPALF